MVVIQDEDKNILTVNTTLAKALKDIGIRKRPSTWLYMKFSQSKSSGIFPWKHYLISRW